MEAREMFSAVLSRLERASADARGSMDSERRLEIRLERIEPELKAAMAKIEEWRDYAEKLRDLLHAAPRKKGKPVNFPPVPNPLETDIPF
jgi:DNA repair exonuclease SbcCD ATPase subunit